MQDKPPKPTLKQVIGSVLAAMFGVQNSKSHQRDFSAGKPSHYIVVGIIMVILFVLILYGIVRLVLANIVS